MEYAFQAVPSTSTSGGTMIVSNVVPTLNVIGSAFVSEAARKETLVAPAGTMTAGSPPLPQLGPYIFIGGVVSGWSLSSVGKENTPTKPPGAAIGPGGGV